MGSYQWSAEKFSSRFAIPIAVSAVSFAAIFIRFSDAHPVAISFYRFFFSTMILSIFVPFRIDEFKKITRREWITLLSTGFFLSFHMVAWVSSLNYTTVASSVVLVTAHPLLVSWISSRYLGEETSKRAYGGIIFALAGIFIMAFSDYSVSKWSLFGDLLAILAMFSVTGYIIRGRQLRQKFSVVTYAFCVYGFSTLFLAAFSLGFSTSFQIYPVREYLIFFSLALIPTMLGHTLYNWALKFVQARVVSVSLLGEPIGATILAFLILNEIPPTLTIFGASITLIGIFICEKYG
ncbi:hypothetical protein AKJ62_00225 [candidate division MSBL1 archaeon SCGC-AAA259D14]|uniref:EamA domain-containing protein n=1 Tax=candidate division MSBL1 archaeon SCGC-AAA259D14 TaxID=1698261 RepID=A0A133U909_9EURY|nr:hypothetical protein AKJ62_00225 [candidate division MSBL1 archaeon SCGC-AAA259D14]